MTVSIERLKGCHYEEFLDFIDLVFSQHSNPHHFDSDLPLLFAPTDEAMSAQYVIRENGCIRSAVGAIPYTYYIDGQAFATKTITNVATHHKHTGKGYMGRLLHRALADMRAEGVDFATLNGNLERYRFFGFQRAGVTNQMSFTRENTHNRIKQGLRTSYRFEPIHAQDTAAVGRALALFEAQPQRYHRPAQTFMQTLHMWHSVGYSVLDEQGEYAGYLCLSADRSHVREMLLIDGAAIEAVVGSLLLQMGLRQVLVFVSPFDAAMLHAAMRAADGVGSQAMCRVNVLRLEGLLAACLNSKLRSLGTLPQGELVLQTPFGRHSIRHDGRFTVTPTDAPPQLMLDVIDTYALLFGPNEYVLGAQKAPLGDLGVWFPVPLFIHHTDRY